MDPTNNQRVVLTAATLNGLAIQRAKYRAELAAADENIFNWDAKVRIELKALDHSVQTLKDVAQTVSLEEAAASIVQMNQLGHKCHDAFMQRDIARKTRAQAAKKLEDAKKQEVNPNAWEARSHDIFQQLAGVTEPSVILITDDRLEELIKKFVPKQAGDTVKKLARKIPEALAVFTPLRLMAAVVYNHDQQSLQSLQSLQMVTDSESEEPSSFLDGTPEQVFNAIRASVRKQKKGQANDIQEDVRTRIFVCRMVDHCLATMKQQNGTLNDNRPRSFDDIEGDLDSDDGSSQRDAEGRGSRKKVRLDTAVTSTQRDMLMKEPLLLEVRVDLARVILDLSIYTDISIKDKKFTSTPKFREMMNQGRVLGKLIVGFEYDSHPKLPIFDFMVAIGMGSHHNVSKIPTSIWNILHSCLVQAPNLKNFIDTTKIFTDPKGFVEDPSRADLIDDIRSLQYVPGLRGNWSFGLNSTYSIKGHIFSPEVSSLRVAMEEVTRAAHKLEYSGKNLAQIGMMPDQWVVVMKFVCGYIASNLKVLDKDQLLQFKWLTTVPSTEHLTDNVKSQNRQTWEHGDQAAFAALMDNTPGQETYALAAFETGGQIDGSATIHVICHYDHPQHDWVGLISRLFPGNYPIHAKDIMFHASIPGAQGYHYNSDSHSRLNSTGMLMLTDFIHLVIAGKQYEGETMPPVSVMRRKILVHMTKVCTNLRQQSRKGGQ